ncbi:hypothetical protein [Devosia sp. 1566]|uniref:hypothetical protein n=1 Tax=Devosia sp. 1566 TaxID=2499144 RepID=UPI000FD7DC36|nr:hypothetical protein [Devosia sp. 1566]
MLRDSFGAFGGQVIKAAQRGDAVAISHRSAAFLGSYFDVLFAANRATHPGEKRLVQLAARLPHVPKRLEDAVLGLPSARASQDIAACVDALADGVLKVLETSR